MTLHRTPHHLAALKMVRDQQVTWRDTEPGPKGVPVLRRSAGFAHAGGCRFDTHVLVALWELRSHKLIAVDGEAVRVTDLGRDGLREWDPARAGGGL